MAGVEVPAWVSKMLSVEDNKDAWDWVNKKVAAATTPEAVFGSGPTGVVCAECMNEFKAPDDYEIRSCSQHRKYVYEAEEETWS